MHRFVEAQIKGRVLHVWVFLALLAVGLACYSLVDLGNIFGVDEWAVIYTAEKGVVSFANSRPFANLSSTIFYPLAGMKLIPNHALLILVKVGAAFALYLLVQHFTPDDRLFAFTCGSLYLSYTVLDGYPFIIYPISGINTSQLLLTLLALYLYFKHVTFNRPVLFIVAVVLAVVSIGMRESNLPMILGLPVIEFLYRREFTRSRIVSLAVWIILLVLAAASWYVFPLMGSQDATYSSSLFSGLSLNWLIDKTLLQFRFAFKDLSLTEIKHLKLYRLPILLAVGVTLLGTTIIYYQLSDRFPQPTEEKNRWRFFLGWLVLGVISTWLGFAAFLPTPISAGILRVHILSAAGSAVALASLVWLVSYLGSRSRNHQWVVRYTGIALLTAFGVAQIGLVQDDLYYLGSTWETQAYYLRSLAHLAPSVKDNTLFVYMQDPTLDEAPFQSGWALHYAVKYLYEDTAEVVFVGDNLFGHSWVVTDEGIEIIPNPDISHWVGRVDTKHSWSEMIFVTKGPDYEAVILEDLPEDFYTASRAEQYNPFDRIERSYIPSRVEKTLPPIQPLNRRPMTDE